MFYTVKFLDWLGGDVFADTVFAAGRTDAVRKVAEKMIADGRDPDWESIEIELVFS